MKVKLFINKSVGENASIYFDKAKKLKKKLEGANKALDLFKDKFKKIEKEELDKPAQVIKKQRKQEWFEKFRWFFSSEDLLCIGGRDATTNEIVIKKYTEKDDIVFHTDMAGSPFFVIKTENKKISEITLNEVAIATASFSKAWKNGLGTLDVFYVNPDQVSKEANSGEYMTKGAFMIRGKTNYLNPEIKLAITNNDGQIICGPLSAIKRISDNYIIIIPGSDKTSDIAKKIRNKIGGDLDEIIRALPSGGSRIIE